MTKIARLTIRRAGFPCGRIKAAAAILAESYLRLIQRHPIPELASHLFMHLIQPFAIISEFAAPDLIAASQSDF